VDLSLSSIWFVVDCKEQGDFRITETDLLTLMLTGAKSDIADTLRIRAVPGGWGIIGLPGNEGLDAA